jgi:hypothetical protein
MRSLLQRISNADKVIVNYTGGTKAMSAAIVHAALTTSFAGESELHYVGGTVRDKNGRVIREAMETRKTARTLTQERMEQILDLMKGHRYELAAYLAEGLPELGRPAFIKKASRSLLLWDNFAYEKAADSLRGLYQQAQGFVDDQRLGKLAETVRRLVSEVITPVLNTIRAFREWEKGEKTQFNLKACNFCALTFWKTLQGICTDRSGLRQFCEVTGLLRLPFKGH